MSTNQQPDPTLAANLDHALDRLAAGDDKPLRQLDPDAAETMAMLQEWASLADLANYPLPDLPPDQPTQPQGPAMSTTIPASTMPATATPRARAHRRIRPTTLVSFASWVLIVAIIGGAVFGIGSRLWPSDSPPTTPAHQPVLGSPVATPTTSLATELNPAGDAGASWVMGDTAAVVNGVAGLPDFFRSDVTLTDQPLIVGNLLVTSYWSEGKLHTVAIDLSTQTLAWEADQPILGPFASDGTVIYGSINPGGDGPGDSGPAMLNVATGAQVKAIDAWQSWPTVGATVAIADGLVYYGAPSGEVHAYAAGTLDEVWAWLPKAGRTVPYSTPIGVSQAMASPSVLVAGKSVFMTLPGKTVVRLERTTGKLTGQFNVVDDIGLQIDNMTIQARGDVLVVTAFLVPVEESGASQSPAMILTYDAESLAMTSGTDIYMLGSNVVATQDSLIFAGSIEPGRASQVFTMPITEPWTVSAIANRELETPESFWLSSTGSTLMVVTNLGAVDLIDLTTNQVTSNGEPGAGTGPFFPMMIWKGTPVMVNGQGDILIFPNEPSAQ